MARRQWPPRLAMRPVRELGRRNVFLRYLREVAGAVSSINRADREALYEQLLAVAKKRTAEADVKLDKRGRPVDDDAQHDFGEHVLIGAHHLVLDF